MSDFIFSRQKRVVKPDFFLQDFCYPWIKSINAMFYVIISNFKYIFLSRLCNIRLKYPRRLHGLGEEQQKGKRLKMHRLITYPTSSTNCNTEKNK